MVSAKSGYPTGMPAAGMSDMGRVRGSRVITQCAGLFMDGGAWDLSDSGVVMSTLKSTTVVSASLTEFIGPAPGLTVVERKQGESLTKLAWLIWVNNSLKVVSTCLVILAYWSTYPWSSCFTGPPVPWSLWPAGPPFLGYFSSLVLMCLENPSHLRSSFHSSWALAWVATCNCLRAALKPITSFVWEPMSIWGWEQTEGTDSGTRVNNQGPSSELTQRASLRNGMTLRLSPSFSHSRMTWVEEYRSNWHSWTLASGNWAVEALSERMAISR